VLNTGVVGSLNATLNGIGVNNPAFAEDLKTLAEKISSSSELEDDKKEEAIEALTFIGEQSKIEVKRRNKLLIKTATQIIKSTISLAADLVTVVPLAMNIINAVKPG
jgi:hypothetical protein